jgi:hypothetical protein
MEENLLENPISIVQLFEQIKLSNISLFDLLDSESCYNNGPMP